MTGGFQALRRGRRGKKTIFRKRAGWSGKRTQLEYFVRIVEEKSFTKAAEKLFVSQPALSKAIRALEGELEVSLFRREPGALRLTEEGETVYRFAADMLAYWDRRTAELLSILGRAKETLRFGLPPSVGSVFFSGVLFEYRQRFPQTVLQIFEGTSKQIEAMIAGGDLDLGLVLGPYEDPTMMRKTVFRSEVVAAVGKDHRLAGCDVVDLSQLRHEPMVLVSKEYMFHDQILERCREAGFTPNVIFTSLQWDLLLEMVAEGRGVTIICRPLVEKLYSGRVACVPIRDPEFPWILELIANAGQPLSGAAKSLWDFCGQRE